MTSADSAVAAQASVAASGLLNSDQVFWLVVIGLGVFMIGGTVMLYVKYKSPDFHPDINITTVVVVIFAGTVLTLAGVVEGQAAVAVLSGIVGYVLGALPSKRGNGGGSKAGKDKVPGEEAVP